MTSPLPEDKQEYTSCWGMPEKSEARAQRHLGLGPEICWYPGAPHILPYPFLHLSLSLSSQGSPSKGVIFLMIYQLSLPL